MASPWHTGIHDDWHMSVAGAERHGVLSMFKFYATAERRFCHSSIFRKKNFFPREVYWKPRFWKNCFRAISEVRSPSQFSHSLFYVFFLSLFLSFFCCSRGNLKHRIHNISRKTPCTITTLWPPLFQFGRSSVYYNWPLSHSRYVPVIQAEIIDYTKLGLCCLVQRRFSLLFYSYSLVKFRDRMYIRQRVHRKRKRP